jgi:hypothetical protein
MERDEETCWLATSVANAQQAEEEPYVVNAVSVPLRDFSICMGPPELLRLRNALFVSIVLYKRTEICDEPRHVFLNSTLRMKDSIALRTSLWKEVVLVLVLTKSLTMKSMPVWSHILKLHTMSMELKASMHLHHHLQLMQAAIHIATNHLETSDNVHVLMPFFQRRARDQRERDAADRRHVEDLRKGRDDAAARGSVTLHAHGDLLFDSTYTRRFRADQDGLSQPCSTLAEHLSLLVYGGFLALATNNVDKFQDVLASAQNVAFKLAAAVNHLELEGKLVAGECSIGAPSKRSPCALEFEMNARLVGMDAMTLREMYERTMAGLKLSRSPEVNTPAALPWLSLMNQFEHMPAAHATLSIFLELDVRQLLHPIARTLALVLCAKNMVLVTSTTPTTAKDSSTARDSSSADHTDHTKLLESVLGQRPCLSVLPTKFEYTFTVLGTKEMADDLLASKGEHILHGSILPCDPFKIMNKHPFLGCDPVLALDTIAHFDNIFARHTSESPAADPMPLRLRFAARLAYFAVADAYSHLASGASAGTQLGFINRYAGTLEGLVVANAYAYTRSVRCRSGHLGNVGNRKAVLQNVIPDSPATAHGPLLGSITKPFWKVKNVDTGGGGAAGAGGGAGAAGAGAGGGAGAGAGACGNDETHHKGGLLDFQVEVEFSVPDILDTVFNRRDNPDIRVWLSERGYSVEQLRAHTKEPEDEADLESYKGFTQRAPAAAGSKVQVLAPIKGVVVPQTPQVIQIIEGCIEEGFMFMDDVAGLRLVQSFYIQLCNHFEEPFVYTVLIAPAPQHKGRPFVDSRNPKCRTLIRKKQFSGYAVAFMALDAGNAKLPRNHANLSWLPGLAPITLPETVEWGIPWALFDSHVDESTHISVEEWIFCAVLRELRVIGLEPTVWNPEDRSHRPAAATRAFNIRAEPPSHVFPLVSEDHTQLDPVAVNFMQHSAAVKFINGTKRLAGGSIQAMSVISVKQTQVAYLVVGRDKPPAVPRSHARPDPEDSLARDALVRDALVKTALVKTALVKTVLLYLDTN